MPCKQLRVSPGSQVLLLLLSVPQIEAVRVRASPPEVQARPSAQPHGQVSVPTSRAPDIGPRPCLGPGSSPDVRQGGVGAQGRLIAGKTEPPDNQLFITNVHSA